MLDGLNQVPLKRRYEHVKELFHYYIPFLTQIEDLDIFCFPLDNPRVEEIRPLI